MIAADGDAALRIDFHSSQGTVRAATVILGGAGDAGADDDPALLPARLLLAALLPDRVLLKLVQNLRRADRDTVWNAGHGLAAGRDRVAPPELDRIERQRRRRL